jgi:hypothetical protein
MLECLLVDALGMTGITAMCGDCVIAEETERVGENDR